MHEGHRKRMKERMAKEGLMHFAPHEVLEVLLFFGVPTKDVNPLAHELIARFGSLSAVLDASPEELARCPGVGANVAALLSMVPQLAGYYMRDKYRDKPLLKNANDAGDFCQTLFLGQTNESLYLICLDAQTRVIHPALLAEGTIDEITIYPRAVVDAAIRHDAHSVLITHNHPGGSLLPSPNDYDTTKAVMAALGPIGIRVLDHIIVGEGQFLSLAQCSFMRQGLLVDEQEFELRLRMTTLPNRAAVAREAHQNGGDYDVE